MSFKCSFIIFQSILSDHWMPWLEENRKEEKFATIIRMAGKDWRNTSGRFFGSLYQILKKHESLCNDLFRDEIHQLAGLLSDVENLPDFNEFIGQPVRNQRDNFYNALISRALTGYCYQVEKQLNTCESPEFRAFFISGLERDLYQILQTDIPESLITPADKQIAAWVKLAILVLMHRIRKISGNENNSELAGFDIWGWFEDFLLEYKFQEKQSDQLLDLLDDLISKDSVKPASSVKIPLNTNKESKQEPVHQNDISNYELLKVIQSYQKDQEELKNMIITLVPKENTKPEKPNTDKYYSSKEVCDLIKISNPTLHRYRKTGKIKFIKIGKKILYEKEYIHAFINNHKMHQKN